MISVFQMNESGMQFALYCQFNSVLLRKPNRVLIATNQIFGDDTSFFCVLQK